MNVYQLTPRQELSATFVICITAFSNTKDNIYSVIIFKPSSTKLSELWFQGSQKIKIAKHACSLQLTFCCQLIEAFKELSIHGVLKSLQAKKRQLPKLGNTFSESLATKAKVELLASVS